MTKNSQRLAATAFLLLLAGSCWWLTGDSDSPVIAPSRSPSELPQEPPALSRAAPKSLLSARHAAALGEVKGIEDRFALAPVLSQRQTSREENGVTKIQRIRLVRKDDFKYPIIRVEDELVAGPGGDRLTKQVAMVGDHVLIKLQNPKISEATILSQFKDAGVTIRRKMPASGTWLIAFADPTVDTVPQAIARLSNLKQWVRYAEPDFIVHALATPNDANFTELWGMHNTGQSSGIADADIDATEAWDLHTGSPNVVVAVIDSGIDHTHPDLAANIWINPNEIAGNGIDDDENGYVDDTRGWDFVNNDSSPNDDNSHGTHCAGTIGGVGSNGIGVAGVCWDVSLVGLKFLDQSGNGSLSDGVEAIAYATHAGVALTSNSWGGGGFSQAMKDAILEADTAGILFVAAAGNDAANIDFYPVFPASYDSPNVIVVSALTRQDLLADYSNFGLTNSDLGAPGSSVYSTMPGGGYGIKSGTSMAAPHVSGACALLLAYRPELTHAQVKDLILRTVDVTPAMTGITTTGGRLNLFSAMLASDDILATPGSDFIISGSIGGPFSPTSKTYTLTNHSSTTSEWTATVNCPWITLSAQSGSLEPSASIQINASLNDLAAGLLAGDYSGAITFTNTATGRVQIRQVKLRALPPPLYVYDLNTDPGWTRTGAWQYGVPSGSGAALYGKPDPSSGATGSRVFGINLNGDYSVAIGAAQYLTAGPFNLSSHQQTALRFKRWLNSDYQVWVYATIEVSNNGVVWYPVWDNGTVPHTASEWTDVEYDLSAHADGKSNVYVRWGHSVAAPDAFPLSGWNIDDVEILALPDRQLRLTLPEPITEGGTPGVAKITVAPVPVSNLTVTITSDRAGSEISFPATVTILAGQESATFNVSPINDTVVDGSQTVILTASVGNFPPHSASMKVHDNESGQLNLILPSNLTEGAGTSPNVAQISLPAPAAVDIGISLASNDTSELVVPSSVILLAGQTTATFGLTVVDDNLIDGTQTAGVIASVTSWPTAFASTQVLDNEPRTFTVTVPAVTMENSGTISGAGTVTLQSPVENELTVNLLSTDTSEVTVASTVIIPPRTSGASFDITLPDDGLDDGPQVVQVIASADDFVSGTAFITVNDDEIPSLPVLPTPANGSSSRHPETDLAWQIQPGSGGVPEFFEVYFGTNATPAAADFVGTTSSASRALPRLTPGETYYWQVIARKGTASRAGAIWSFTVAPVGPLTHFGWEPLPSGISAGAPFNARLIAYDQFENPVTNFTGQAALSSVGGGPESTTGTGTIQWELPLATFFHDSRTQSIYLASEVGPAGSLSSLGLDLAVVPGQVMRDLTIRLKHTSKESYSASNGKHNWETDGWTTVYKKNTTITATGLSWFVFSVPFAYDGSSNLMVDISFNNSSFSSYGKCRATPVAEYRSLWRLSDSLHGDPTTWLNSTPLGSLSYSLPNLRFRRSEFSVPVTPTLVGPFINGTWTGEVTVAEPGTALRLLAHLPSNNTISGFSEAFDVITAPTLSLADEPLYSGGTTNLVSWIPLGPEYEYEIQQAVTADFTAPVSTGFLAGTAHTFHGLSDGQIYHYRARARANGVTGPWSTPLRSTQDATAPHLNFTPPSGGVIVASSLTLAGTGVDHTSGIAHLSVNGILATSSDGFSQWQWPVSGLHEGGNTLSVTVQDSAVPPNTRTQDWTITRITNVTADIDRNGVGALLEYAFNAPGIEGPSALPRISAALDSQTLEDRLTISYRRRLNASGLEYHVETSGNLTSWSAVGDAAETLSVTPTGDGVTETVLLHIQPSSGETPTFVRVRVEVP